MVEPTSLFDGLVVYGPIGICCVYFMFKDWVKSKETDKVIEANTSAMKEFTVAINLAMNGNGGTK